MAKLNPIDVIKCRNQITLKNLSFKNAGLSILSSLSSALGNVVGSAVGSINQVVGQAKNAAEDASLALARLEKNLKSAYDNIPTTVSNIRDTISGMVTSTCTAAESTDTNTQVTNVVSEIISLPDSNDPATTASSPTMAYVKAFKDAKSVARSSPLIGMATQIGNINNKLSTMGILETREFVRQFKNLHPLIDGYVNLLNNFKPISESIGASYLAFTVDKQDLQLEYWNQKPKSIRQNIKLKLRPEIYTEIEAAYTALNTGLVNNISNEFFTEGGGNRLRADITVADDYHLKGDWWWFKDHIETAPETKADLINKIQALLFQMFKDQYIQINYLNPITENILIQNDTYNIPQEGTIITVDKRNNPVYFPSTVINNNVLKPAISPET